MKVGICDDDPIIVNKYYDFNSRLSGIYPEVIFDIFDSTEALLKQYEHERPYDILFLDIEINRSNGIEIAKKIREIDSSVIIVYVTNYSKYVYSAFEVNPLRFLLKPVTYEKFAEIFSIAYEKVLKNKRAISITTDRKILRFNCDEVYYFESQKRIVKLHTKSESFSFYGRLEKINEELHQNDFISTHKSFTANLNFVYEIDASFLQLTNGVIIPISENRRKYVREEHMKFIKRCYWR